jgi:hypothetical protein
MEKEVTYSSEASLENLKTTLIFIKENRTVHNHRCDNLESSIILQTVSVFRITEFLDFVQRPEF